MIGHNKSLKLTSWRQPMKRAGGNELAFRTTLASKFGKDLLLGKRAFRIGSQPIETSVDEHFLVDDLTVLWEIDSGNAAKLVLGEYILLNELTRLGTDPQSCLVIVHFYKGYNAVRTTGYASFVRDSIYGGHGLPVVAVSWPDLQMMAARALSPEQLVTGLFGRRPSRDNSPVRAQEVLLYDRKTLAERTERLAWLNTVVPSEYFAFHGGLATLHLFEDMRSCYAHGNLLAVVVVGLAFIEHTLAAALFSRGHEEAAALGFQRIVKTLQDLYAFPHGLSERLTVLSPIRNRIAHFRAPTSPEEVSTMALATGRPVAELWEQDAVTVVKVAADVLRFYTAHF